MIIRWLAIYIAMGFITTWFGIYAFPNIAKRMTNVVKEYTNEQDLETYVECIKALEELGEELFKATPYSAGATIGTLLSWPTLFIPVAKEACYMIALYFKHERDKRL